MNWFWLVLGGLFEVGFTTCLGLSQNFRHLGWTLAFLVSVTLSMVLLGKAAQTIPLGTAYAVWTGIGAVGTAVVGMVLFREPAEFWRLFFITLLIGSIIGLKAVSH